MANTYSPAFATITNSKAQETLKNMLIGRGLCNTATFTSNEARLGDTIDRVYRSGVPTVESYVRGTDVTVADATYNSDTLVIDQEKNTQASYIDQFDTVQDVVGIMEKEAEVHAYALANFIDSAIFAQMAADAGTTYGVTGGAWDSGSAAPATVAEFDGALFVSLISELKKTLGTNNALEGERFVVVDHNQYQVAEEKLISLGFNTADAVIGDGFKGRFRGVEIYASNNILVTTGTPDYTSIIGGVKGSTDLAMQVDIEMLTKDAPLKNGKHIWSQALYGIDTPVSLKPQLVEFLVDQE